MLTPDDHLDAQHLLRLMQDQGVEVTATLSKGFPRVRALDTDGQVCEVTRDDMNLLAAVCECAEQLGWEFGG